MRRLAWRNERSIYKRKCDKTGREIVSIFSPDKKDYTVYDQQIWWGDTWDAMEYGQDFDPNQPFFKQLGLLNKKVPKLSLNNINTVNSEYGNHVMEIKNCYMSVVTYYGSEDVHYSYGAFTCKNSIDLFISEKCENSYRLIYCDNCYNCRYSQRLNNCTDCYYSIDLTACSNCLFCSNLKHKEYHIHNKKYSKEDYEKELQKYDFGSWEKSKQYWQEFVELKNNSIVKFANNVNCDNCSGDDLTNCKDVKYSFSQKRSEHSKYSLRGVNDKYCYDYMGGDIEWGYEFLSSGYGSSILFCYLEERSANLAYCISCFGCRDCFGCVGLKNKQYCVFNKEYSKESYEAFVAKIIERMMADKEWGEFYPYQMSPFGFNETLGYSYYPIKKEEALKLGAKWQDDDFGIKFDGKFYEPEDDIEEYNKSQEKREELLNGVLKCEVSGKPFKIVPQELAFYMEQKVPIPRKHYDIRYKENFALQNPRKLWHRQCVCEEKGHGHEGRCKNEFETTYASDRPEKVYCEKCYQKSVI